MTAQFEKDITPNGREYWYKDDKLHRLDGPAARYPDGTKYWYKDDKWHRLDGPAVTRSDGTERWWLGNNRWPVQHRDWWERER